MLTVDEIKLLIEVLNSAMAAMTPPYMNLKYKLIDILPQEERTKLGY